MVEKIHTQKRSKREIFQSNLEEFPSIVSFYDRDMLKHGFKPHLHKQETCLLQFFSTPNPVTLRYLDVAVANVGAVSGFYSKAKELGELRTNDGFAQFNSVLIELWFATLFIHHNLLVIPEPNTTKNHKAEFKVTKNDSDVYFESFFTFELELVHNVDGKINSYSYNHCCNSPC